MTNIILGFGSNEIEFREKTNKEIKKIVIQYIENNKVENFYNTECQRKLENIINDLSLNSREQSSIHDKNKVDPPERYSYFYTRTHFDFSSVVIVVDYRHINRKHPFSPDGWALYEFRDFLYLEI